MNGPLPYGGREIVELRAIRKRPADMVLVSLVGPLRELNPIVVARPERTYDWRFLTGLDVLLVASSATDKSLVRRIADAVAAVDPSYLGLWLADKQNGVHIAFGCWRPKTKLCRMMGLSDRREFEGIGYASH